jgi:hypothetical protein
MDVRASTYWQMNYPCCAKHNVWMTTSRMIEVQDFSGATTNGKKWIAVPPTCPLCDTERLEAERQGKGAK